MSDLSLWPVVVATAASFLASGIWYAVTGRRLAHLSADSPRAPRSAAATAATELGRGLVLSITLAVLVRWTGTGEVVGVLGLATLLFVGFPVVLLWGSVWHEGVAPAVAAIHAGDWLVKLVLVTAVVGLWPSP